jgi:putative membrane protein
MWGHEGMTCGLGGWWMIIIWIVVIVGIVFLVKWLVEQGRTGRQTSEKEESPLDILKKRYAKGEIDREEFERKKRDLTGS